MIVPLEELRDTGGILCHGCFDLMHAGHIRYIEWARSLAAGPLIVTLTADDFFPKYKRPKPAFDENIRAECLDALRFVDFVAIVREPSAVLAILTIKPRIYAKGWEAKGKIAHEEDALKLVGGEVRFMDEAAERFSSGSILSGEYMKNKCSPH